MPTPRLSYKDSCGVLQQRGFIDVGVLPPIPNHLPQCDDHAPRGVNFFRTFVGDGMKLQDLSLPRTFFGRSEINDASFKNTDLTESNLSWNDFTNVDFSDAVLARSDMRASLFEKVQFVRADLRDADMRQSQYIDCRFDDALMDGARLTHDQGDELELTYAQRAVIDWQDDDGPEPGGG